MTKMTTILYGDAMKRTHPCDGFRIYFESGSWWLDAGDDVEIPVKFCPNCGIRLSDLRK